MNEQRIRELAKQAGFYPENNWDHTNWHAAGHNPTFEKFAELIVRDCMEVASPNYMSTPEDSVYYVEQAIDRIAEHFGVEE